MKKAIVSLLLLTMFVLGGCQATEKVAVEESKVELAEKISDKEESSYSVKADVQATDFSKVGKTLSDEIERHWEGYNKLSELERLLASCTWGMVYLQVDTWKEAEEAVGRLVSNPLESIEWLEPVGFSGIDEKMASVNIQHVLVKARSESFTNQNVNMITMESGYSVDDIDITIKANLYADSGVQMMESICFGYATYEQKTMTMGSGQQVLVVITNETNDDGYYTRNFYDPTAYWVKDNVLYEVRLLGEEANKEEIDATLERILEEL